MNPGFIVKEYIYNIWLHIHHTAITRKADFISIRIPLVIDKDIQTYSCHVFVSNREKLHIKKPAQPILYAVCWYYVMASIPQSSQDYHESVSYYFM